MSQIVKKRKKGRPSKADLAKRAVETAAEIETRRSIRRRNVRYNIDFDDYEDFDFDDDDDEEVERRREKKLKLVLKLNNTKPERKQRSNARVNHAPPESAVSGSSSEYYEEGNKPFKKRKIDGCDEVNNLVHDNDDEGNDGEDEIDDDDDEQERGQKGDSKAVNSAPETPSDQPSGVPLPDKKVLELILDKLQKKDTYGVYAEPVDPEELPDYHDVIEHPMDFSTVRKKLSNGSYSTLEQFESDVFLICSNAMQYNAPETIYHKQARSIQELATKKFQRLRIEYERSEKELKSEQKMRSSSIFKKPVKKPISHVIQEPVGSDFSSGATLATAGDVQTSSNAFQASTVEKTSVTDGLVDNGSSQVDNNVEKAEDPQFGKNFLPKLGRKLSVVEENRRATYNLSCQPLVQSESIFTTFDSEAKQLVAVGLQAEYFYARSLVRFAATLGPTAWKVASKRIEQVLPVGFKFGRGWVGEYEPLPTPILVFENRSQGHLAFGTKLPFAADSRKDDSIPKLPVVAKELSPKEHAISRHTLEGKPHFLGFPVMKSANTPSSSPRQQNPSSRNFVVSENKVTKEVELNGLPPANTNMGHLLKEMKPPKDSVMNYSRPMDLNSRSSSFVQPVPFKQPSSNGVVVGGLPNGKPVSISSGNNRSISSDNVPNQSTQAPPHFSQVQEQSLTEPVQLMRILAEQSQKQQKFVNHSMTENSPAIPLIPSSRGNDSNNAAAAAARAWMSIGAGGFRPPNESSNPQRNQISADSLYNPARELHPQMTRFWSEFPLAGGVTFQKNSFPFQALVPHPVQMGNEAQFQARPMVFPQLTTADLSRFQVQSAWQVQSPHAQTPRQKQENLPPDLNISFQSPGSPVRQSSNVMVDSQQPDLALQL
ncbi:Bromodomain [Dillenia turbinata]|uniref:Bromodomain n=1 Tax=Dillenia turbinata TaxID=194707 RepID=A0AAN8W687_9MAGN